MIDSHSLRKGNIVTTTAGNNIIMTTGIPFVVFTIGFGSSELLNDLVAPWAQQEPFEVEHRFIDPIPITPRWLEVFGLEKMEFLQHSIIKQDDGYLIYTGHNCMHVKVKHVHQLQNLYYAFTGKELPIKIS